MTERTDRELQPCLPEGFDVDTTGYGNCPECGGWFVSEVDAREFDWPSGEAIDDTDLFIQCLRCKTTWPGPVELRMAIDAAAMAEGGEQ